MGKGEFFEFDKQVMCAQKLKDLTDMSQMLLNATGKDTNR